MSGLYAPGDTFCYGFTLQASNGARINADPGFPPTFQVTRWTGTGPPVLDAAFAAAIAFVNLDTGNYDAYGTYPANYGNGDCVVIKAIATVGGVTGEQTVSSVKLTNALYQFGGADITGTVAGNTPISPTSFTVALDLPLNVAQQAAVNATPSSLFNNILRFKGTAANLVQGQTVATAATIDSTHVTLGFTVPNIFAVAPVLGDKCVISF